MTATVGPPPLPDDEGRRPRGPAIRQLLFGGRTIRRLRRMVLDGELAVTIDGPSGPRDLRFASIGRPNRHRAIIPTVRLLQVRLGYQDPVDPNPATVVFTFTSAESVEDNLAALAGFIGDGEAWSGPEPIGPGPLPPVTPPPDPAPAPTPLPAPGPPPPTDGDLVEQLLGQVEALEADPGADDAGATWEQLDRLRHVLRTLLAVAGPELFEPPDEELVEMRARAAMWRELPSIPSAVAAATNALEDSKYDPIHRRSALLALDNLLRGLAWMRWAARNPDPFAKPTFGYLGHPEEPEPEL